MYFGFGVSFVIFTSSETFRGTQGNLIEGVKGVSRFGGMDLFATRQ